MHFPSHIDLGVYIGTIGLFFVFFLLFARFFPVLALNEVKTILKSSGESFKNDTAPVHPYFAKHGHSHGHDDHDNTHNH
jgi:molybdopterin-containing oxidoreductase family membrane subunit